MVEKDKIRYLYKITNLISNMVYIGQTRHFKRRWYEHTGESRKDLPKTHIDRIIKQYGQSNFIYEHIASSKNKDDANCAETQLISQYNSMDKNIGYNKSPGGDLFSDEHCKMMSEKRSGKGNTFFGKKHSEKSLQKMKKNNSKRWLGKTHTEETKKKMSIAQVGKILSEEHKINISKSKIGQGLGKKMPIAGVLKAAKSRKKLTDEQEASLINSTKSAKELADQYGIKISLVYNLRNKKRNLYKEKINANL